MTEFPVDRPITVVVTVPSGRIEVVAADVAAASVDVQPHDGRDSSRELAERATVELDGDILTVNTPRDPGRFLRRGGSLRVRATVPTGSGARIDSASADVRLRGSFATTEISGASADVEIAEVTGDARVKTASGEVTFGRVGGGLTIGSASGDVAVGYVGGPATINTASGDVEVREADGDVRVKTASGDVRVDAARRGTVSAATASGDVRVGVPAGTAVWLDLNTMSGNTRNDLRMTDGNAPPPNGHQLGIEVRTLSGDITIRRVG